MTKLLASVCTPAEALMALDAGVDIIDLKDPAQGALGALSLGMIKEIVQLIDGRVLVSATIGDIPAESPRAMLAIEHTASLGVDIVKVGFFSGGGYGSFLANARSLTEKGIRLVAVLFADQDPDIGILHQLKKAGFFGVMMDTANKNDKNLKDYISIDGLKEFLTTAHQLGLETGLAGSLQLVDIPLLAPLGPSYLGFRGGLCEQLARGGNLQQGSLIQAKNMLQESNSITEYAGWA